MTQVAMALVLVMSGVASQYAPGVMNGPIRNRTTGRAAPAIRHDHDRFDGYAAAMYPHQIDQVWRVCPENPALACRDLLVVDCAGIPDGGLVWMKRNGIVMEVDHETAVAWGTVGRGIRVEVYEIVEYQLEGRHLFH